MRLYEDCVEDLERDMCLEVEKLHTLIQETVSDLCRYYPPLIMDNPQSDLITGVERFLYYKENSAEFEELFRKFVEQSILCFNDNLGTVAAKRKAFLESPSGSSGAGYCVAVLNTYVASLSMQAVLEAILDLSEVFNII